MKALVKPLVVFSLCAWVASAYAADMIVGGDATYVVEKNDNLYLIVAKEGVYWKTIARDNGLDMRQAPAQGAVLRVNTRRIVPKIVDDGIIINIPDRTLYFFRNGKVSFYPVGLGLITKTKTADWRTPTGKFSVVGKRKDPTWYVPESIQMENAMKGKDIEETVPPGPDNPLGKYAIETSIPATLIHATIWPGTVYRYMSHGCIRMLPEHMEELYPLVNTKTKGEIIYDPVKLAIANDGKVYLEVRTDVYKKGTSLKEQVSKVIRDRGVSDRVDWLKINKLIRDESGVAEDVTLTETAQIKKPVSRERVGFAQRIVQFFKSHFRRSI